MYRIRSAAGAEAVYSSLEEFTAAVRRGEVAPEDEIFHSRANRWLDVKSHPHYRSAINWSGPLSSDAIFAPAPPAPAPSPKPAPKPATPANGAGHHGAQPRMQVAELPAAPTAAPKTVYRPQLVSEKSTAKPAAQPAPSPAPAPAPAAPPATAPVVKSKEIPFIDVGPPIQVARQNATIIEARKAPAPRPAAPPAKETDFLVMDTGMDRPARTSSGQRAITGDADMLFDTPLAEAKPSTPAASVVPPTPTPAPAQPAAKVVESPKPQPPAPEPPKTQVAVRPPEPPRISAPVKLVEDKPVPRFAVVERAPEDLDIPGPPLLESPSLAVSPVHEPVPAAINRSSIGLVVGAGAMVMLTAGVLIFWRPWDHRATDAGQPPTTPALATATDTNATTVSMGGAPATESTVTRSGLALPTGKPVELTDSAPGAEEEIIAPRPSFHTEMPVPTGDLNLSSDVSPAGTSAVVAPVDLARRLEAAEKQAGQDLASRIGSFRNVLGAARLGSADGLVQARAAWSAGADAIRGYRARIARLEQAYEDSVLASQRSHRWSGEEMRGWAMHQSLAEPGETSQLTDLMLSQVSEGLDILASLEGQYDLRGGSLRFKNPASATRYLSIRTWVEQRMQGWSGTPEAARPNTVTVILRALGEGFPPVE